MDLKQIAAAAGKAALELAGIPGEVKNKALQAIYDALQAAAPEIEAANKQDLAAAEESRLASPLLKRLKFDTAKLADVSRGILDIRSFAEPVGKTLEARELAEGLNLYKVSCPIGVIGVIFESRPDALVQISALCLKSGNALLLKGGSEAARTNRILAQIITQAACSAGMPEGWLGLLETREDVKEMLSCDEYIDLIIPRGSNEFVQYIMHNTTIPVLGHADGICHVYVDKDAEAGQAEKIVVDSKCQYVAVCNAAETLLVHADIAPGILPRLKEALEVRHVELRGCESTRKIIDVKPATEEDWATEYLDYILSIKIVDDVQAAIDHINKYGSGHTDAIVTTSKETAARFFRYVDAANVFLNCSTRFADGFRYGLGAEVGISTNKIHSRGPVGIEGLLIYKWQLMGSGQIVAEFSGEGGKQFTHKKLNKEFEL